MANRLVLSEDGTGLIVEGPFEGLDLKALLRAYRESAWDWPDTISALGLDDRLNGDTMHPDEPELRALRALAPEETWTEEDIGFDT